MCCVCLATFFLLLVIEVAAFILIASCSIDMLLLITMSLFFCLYIAPYGKIFKFCKRIILLFPTLSSVLLPPVPLLTVSLSRILCNHILVDLDLALNYVFLIACVSLSHLYSVIETCNIYTRNGTAIYIYRAALVSFPHTYSVVSSP